MQLTMKKQTGINADRWIIFIFFMMGLSIGVHLLNLLTIPAIVMVYYYKRYKTNNQRRALGISYWLSHYRFCAKSSYSIHHRWCRIFRHIFCQQLWNAILHWFYFIFLLLSLGIWYALKIAKRKNYGFLRLGIWVISFMLIGYSTYLTTMIRSNADPAVDMYNVDNPMSLVGYLGREQYGDFPLLYGQKFTAQPTEY